MTSVIWRRWRQVPSVEIRAILASLVAGVLLLGVKFTAYLLTGSTAVLADALEGVVNVAASVVAAYALVWAHEPADSEHPYGHGKIEFFAAGFEGGMILLAAVITLGKVVEVLFKKPGLNPDKLGWGAGLMVLAVVINTLVGLYLLRTGKRTSSLTLEADGWHLIGDAVTSTAALAALVLIRLTGVRWIDPLAALAVSFYIAWTGIGLVRRSAAGLLDKQDAHDQAMLERILDAHIGPDGIEPRICSYHKLRHRHSGRYHWVDFHIMVPAGWDIDHGHRVASSIEYEIEQNLGEGNATAHVEPCGDSSCGVCEGVQTLIKVPEG